MLSLSILLLPVFSLLISVDASSNCTQLPRPIAPHSCCRYPELFPPSVLDLCSKHLTNNKRSQCFYDCIFSATEICRQSKCNYNKAHDYVDWVMEYENEFVDIYKDAYGKCIEKANNVRGNMVQRFKRNGCDPLPEMIYLCVQNEMFTSCPLEHWVQEDADCVHKRQFIQHCIRDE